MQREPCVYILANRKNGTLHVGVTSNLSVRVRQHRAQPQPGFNARYAAHRLVWFETHESMDTAILREKQLNAENRNRKLDLINDLNPEWADLYTTLP